MGYRAARTLVVAATLVAAGAGGVSGQAVLATVADISEISLEQGCFGCSTGSLVELRRDGLARRAVTGQARHGTADRVSAGRIETRDFDALAKALLAQNFFALDAEYDDPLLRDGAWTVTTVRYGAHEKRVFARAGAAPRALEAVQRAIDAAVTRLAIEAPK